ncbi:nucleotide exchange factor SIL1-like [Mytilus edulis]|uniref:nucleotide exchange factor SIL1-like n=1 Tax=Mytilus edulis TaxID=6550 RepID=UPI0039F0A472
MFNVVNSIRAFNITSLVLFLICCYYMCVSSEHAPGALTVVNTDNDDDNAEVSVENEDSEITNIDPLNVFYPEKEWKKIQPGQAIPAGLHVRMNMETGVNEAKLMDGDDGHKYWKKGEKEGMVNTDSKEFTHEELKRALKDFKATKHDVPNEKKAEEIKQKYRSYDELKEDFKKINMAIKTGQEIVTELFDKLNSTNISTEARETLLEDLEYHLHQYDNAVLFGDLGGISLLVKGLNHTDPTLRSLSAFVLGSAIQNNPKTQINAIESGALHQLIRSLATDPEIAVKKKVLYAISSIVRHFPFAQKKFFELGGLRSLMYLFEDKKLHSLQVKVITLMSDLYEERVHWLGHLEPTEEKYKQYEQIPLKDSLLDHGFCDTMVPLLELPDHDSREKIVFAMLSLYDCCEKKFHNIVSYLHKLEDEYQTLAVDEDEGDYFQQIHKNINSLRQQLSVAYKKDEL